MTKKLLKLFNEYFNEYFVKNFQKLTIVIQKSNIKFRKLHLDKVNMAITKYENHTL